MTWLGSYLGWAALYAALPTAAVWVGAAALGRPLRAATLGVLGASLFFLALTQHPFPDPDALTCPVPGTRPLLRPFDSLARIAEAWRRGGAGGLWSVGPVSTAANLGLCAVIGLLLSLRTARWGVAVLLGAGLTALAELSQLTGLWGLYPCAYRQFEVDDLIFNAVGVLLGFALGRAAHAARGGA